MQLPCRRLRRPAARRSRRWPPVSCSATMASWFRCSLHRTTGMPPWSPRPPRSPRQFRLRSRTSRVPSCPASRQKVSRGRRLPRVWMSLLSGFLTTAWCILSIRPRRLSAGWRVRAQCRRISPATPECASIPETAPRRRRPGNGRRASAGFPPAVWFPSLVGMTSDRPP